VCRITDLLARGLIMKIMSKHHTESDAVRALDRLEQKQKNKPEHKRTFYTIEHEICTGMFNVLDWGS